MKNLKIIKLNKKEKYNFSDEIYKLSKSINNLIKKNKEFKKILNEYYEYWILEKKVLKDFYWINKREELVEKINEIEKQIQKNKLELKEKLKNDLWDLINDFWILTQWFSWRDIKNVIDILWKNIITKNIEINEKTFFDAIEEFLMWKEKEIRIDEETMKRIAYHELWHAIIWFLEWKKILKVSVWEKDISLWQTYSIDENEKLLKDEKYFISEIRLLLWGRGWELVTFWNMSTWAANDYERATTLAISFFHNNLLYETKDWKKLQIWLILNREFDQLPWNIKEEILKYSKILIKEQEEIVRNELEKRKNIIYKYWEYLVKNKVLIWKKLVKFLNELK